MTRLVAAMALAAAFPAAGTRIADLARQMTDAGLDPEECYRVRDLHLAREDVRLYLNEGVLIFGKEVEGVRTSAVFSAEVEGGDAEMLLLPPTRSERLSLAAYARTPNLNEHFHTAVFLFTDRTYEELMLRLRERGEPRKDPERGHLIAERFDPVVRNLLSSFQVRLVKDAVSLNRALTGFFFGAVTSERLGNFDVFYDPTAREQVTAGQVVFRNERTFFDVWTRFEARSFRERKRTVADTDVQVGGYQIEATLEPDLRMRAVTRATVVPSSDVRWALPFEISSQMNVNKALVDGVEAEVFQPDSLRASLIRGDENHTFLVVPPRPLQPGREYPVEFHHEGRVVAEAGNGVYFVGARSSWYPSRGVQFASFELTFRYPSNLDLVATGRVVEDTTEGAWRVTRRRTESPVRWAGFNLGSFEHEKIERNGYTVEVYANRRVETALERKRQVVLMPPPIQAPRRMQRWTVDIEAIPIEVAKPKPTVRLEQLAGEIADALEFMTRHFGPPVLRSLTVSPIPGTFGQGFPGLIYLSTLAYLNPEQRPQAARTELQELFFSEILHAHETAHQWWGNVVTSAGDQDNWLMEALANYSALLYLEQRKGARAAESVLADYRNHLLSKREAGRSLESAGPIIWGSRLQSSQMPDAWRIITYEKGSWILHMLRRRMGDERFLEMLGQLRKRYQFRPVTNEQFRKLAVEFLPPKSPDPQLEGFFEQYVFSTGVPSLKLNFTVRGKAPNLVVSGTVTQSEVDEDFSAHVPIEIQFGRAKPVVHWVRTSSEPVPFKVAVRRAPSRVVLDPGNSILRK